jgi:hypothetical protein
MSNLQQIVKNSLNGRNVSPAIIATVDTYIQRAILRLLKKDFLPPRVWEFDPVDERQIHVVDGETKFEYVYLPEDFRKLDEFFVYGSNKPYFYTSRENELINREHTDTDYKFTIVDNNIETDTKSEKILVVRPFPENKVRFKYYVNGKGTNWDWIDEVYWEAVIAEVEAILGLINPETAKEHSDIAIGEWKNQQGSNEYNKTNVTVKPRYFGGLNNKVGLRTLRRGNR